LHTKLADSAFYIGEPNPLKSYLRSEKIIKIAKNAGVDAIHPGYGFLSENADFAEACAANDIIFMGPPATAIRDMGMKNKAKEIMIQVEIKI
jgi:3-methylcrotonyl-CoA carboxylase alpha subunit